MLKYEIHYNRYYFVKGDLFMDTTSFRYDIKGFAADMEIDLRSVSALYSEYFHEMKENISKSRELGSTGEWQKFQRVIHNIKGISSSLNILDIYDISSKLDIELINNKYDNALMFLNIISNLFNTCEKDIKQFFKQNDITI